MEDHPLAIEDMRAFVMHRTPYFLTGDGTLWLHKDAYKWIEIDIFTDDDCDHKGSMCSKCQEDWYFDHNILLVSRKDPTIHVDFDAIATQYLAECE